MNRHLVEDSCGGQLIDGLFRQPGSACSARQHRGVVMDGLVAPGDGCGEVSPVLFPVAGDHHGRRGGPAVQGLSHETSGDADLPQLALVPDLELDGVVRRVLLQGGLCLAQGPAEVVEDRVSLLVGQRGEPHEVVVVVNRSAEPGQRVELGGHAAVPVDHEESSRQHLFRAVNNPGEGRVHGAALSLGGDHRDRAARHALRDLFDRPPLPCRGPVQGIRAEGVELQDRGFVRHGRSRKGPCTEFFLGSAVVALLQVADVGDEEQVEGVEPGAGGEDLTDPGQDTAVKEAQLLSGADEVRREQGRTARCAFA
ncbi:hypothetical protein ACIBJC_08275 [Streptomyces sp. NPDC050509]|uniref:hypothetical protein n=1 Tax=Streptomyces sp. NPDC050509 TaxID=3365620 RepID=UPI0037BD1E9F